MFEVGRAQLDVFIMKACFTCRPTGQLCNCWVLTSRGSRRGWWGCQRAGPQAAACSTSVESQLSQIVRWMAQVTQCLGEVSFIYSKRIELRWEKKRITVKERESKRCFLLVHLKRQGDIFLSDFALTGQHSLEYFTTRQWKESRSIWRQTNVESFLFKKNFPSKPSKTRAVVIIYLY